MPSHLWESLSALDVHLMHTVPASLVYVVHLISFILGASQILKGVTHPQRDFLHTQQQVVPVCMSEETLPTGRLASGCTLLLVASNASPAENA